MQIRNDDTKLHCRPHGVQVALYEQGAISRRCPLSAGREPVVTVAYISLLGGDQSWGMQLSKLQEYAKRQGWQIAEIYEDLNRAGNGRRSALNRLIAETRARKIRCVLVWRLEMFGRSLVDCLNNIKTLEENGVRFIALTQGLDTGFPNPAARLLQGLAAAAESERALMRARIQAGQVRYQQDLTTGKVGKTVYSRSGRNLPSQRPKKTFDSEAVVRLQQAGRSYRQIAKSIGVGLGTVARALKKHSKPTDLREGHA